MAKNAPSEQQLQTCCKVVNERKCTGSNCVSLDRFSNAIAALCRILLKLRSKVTLIHHCGSTMYQQSLEHAKLQRWIASR